MRVCVFASSSSKTPSSFLAQATRLGALLADHGHVCINGGGKVGGMGALNAAIAARGGVIEGIIHRRWVVDEADFAMSEAVSGSKMVVVDGDDLAERKRTLRATSDCILVLPGGPGTWDELFEVVALRQLGMSTLPVCLINVDGYYDGFIAQMRAAQATTVIKVSPEQLLPVFECAEDALAWAEAEVARGPNAELLAAASAARVNYRSEALAAPPFSRAAWAAVPASATHAATLAAGVLLGLALARST